MVKNSPAMQERISCRRCGFKHWVWEDALEKEMVIRSGVLAWKLLWTEEPGGLQSISHKELDITEQLNNNNTIIY